MKVPVHNDTDNKYRIGYEIQNNNVKVNHFALKTTLPDNPFKPHKHEQEEFWFITDGEGFYFEDEAEIKVSKNDLIYIKSRVLHGLRTETRIDWICLG